MSVQNPILQQFVTNVTNQTFTDATMAGAQWDFQGTSGDCESGKFVTDHAETTSTTRIQMSGVNTAGADSSYILSIGVGNFIRFTDVEGRTIVFMITSMAPTEDGNCIIIGVQFQGGHTPWSGRMVVDFQPGTGA